MRAFSPLPLLVVIGCGSSVPPPEEPTATAAAPSSAEAAAAPQKSPSEQAVKFPETCAGDAGACVMPIEFVKRLCAKAYPELALYFFRKGSPWRRTYVAVKEAAPFNGHGGPSAEEKLVLDEELVILSEKKADTGGMQVSGAGASYDVMRWDGTCATVSAGEVRPQLPPKPKHATVPWRILEDATQEALTKHDKLAAIVTERKNECKGATMGTVSVKCEQANRKLNEIVVDAVRSGTAVPLPAKRP
jgi:hypothetical protein